MYGSSKTTSEPTTAGSIIFNSLIAILLIIAFLLGVWLYADSQRPATYLLNQSDSDHGSTLSQVTLSASNTKYGEFLAAFNGRDEKIFEQEGEVNRVDVSSQIMENIWNIAGDNLTVLHNHTEDTSFSLADLEAAAQWQAQRFVLVTPARVCILEAPDGWPSASKIKQFTEKNTNYESVERLIDEGVLLEVEKDGRIISFSTTGAFMQEAAAQLDLVYTEQSFYDFLNKS